MTISSSKMKQRSIFFWQLRHNEALKDRFSNNLCLSSYLSLITGSKKYSISFKNIFFGSLVSNIKHCIHFLQKMVKINLNDDFRYIIKLARASAHLPCCIWLCDQKGEFLQHALRFCKQVTFGLKFVILVQKHTFWTLQT